MMSIYFSIVSFDFSEADLIPSIISVSAFSLAFVGSGILYVLVDRMLPSKVFNKKKLKNEYANTLMNILGDGENAMDINFLANPTNSDDETEGGGAAGTDKKKKLKKSKMVKRASQRLAAGISILARGSVNYAAEVAQSPKSANSNGSNSNRNSVNFSKDVEMKESFKDKL